MKHLSLFFLILLGLFAPLSLNAQKLQKDNIAEMKVEEGKKYMQTKNYSTAEQCFEFAAMRPINTLTTTAIYLSGLAAYYNQNTPNATYRFNQILTQYPNSKYIHETQYHLALQYLSSEDKRQQLDGMRFLYTLRDGITNGVPVMLTLDATNSLKTFLFTNANPQALELFYPEVKALYKPELTEAICYQKVRTGQKTEAQNFYNEYLTYGGSPSHFIEKIFSATANPSQPKTQESGIKKVALMLPFYAQYFDTDTLNFTPEQSRAALELYEGIEEALEIAEPELANKYILKVWDTNRDPYTVQAQLGQLAQFQPDIIIGEIYNAQSRILSEWAETNGVTQLIPLSPIKAMVEGKQQVFLMNPSTITHGRKAAEFAFRDLGLKNMVIWTDGRKSTDELASAFAYQFRIMGGNTRMIQIDSVFGNNVITQINQNKQELTNAQGAYIPISNEEITGLLLSTIDIQKLRIKIITSPDIQYYSHIETDLKARLNTYFTQNFFPETETKQFEDFLTKHLLHLNAPPTEYQIRGYDIGIYALSVLEYNAYGTPINQKIRDFIPVKGVGSSTFFDREQDNQSVFILQYKTEGNIEKVK